MDVAVTTGRRIVDRLKLAGVEKLRLAGVLTGASVNDADRPRRAP
jgi:hypothetical protein